MSKKVPSDGGVDPECCSKCCMHSVYACHDKCKECKKIVITKLHQKFKQHHHHLVVWEEVEEERVEEKENVEEKVQRKREEEEVQRKREENDVVEPENN